MPTRPTRFSQLRVYQLLFCALAMIGGGVLMAASVLGYVAHPQTGTSVIGVAVGGFIVFAALIILTITPLILKIESTTARQLSDIRDTNDLLEKALVKLEIIAENTRISDAAKSLAHRDEEIEALRQTIREDIRNGRWEAAFALVNDLSHRFGYEDEAAELRGELDTARAEVIAAKVEEVVATIEQHIGRHDWDRASREIDRLRRAVPDDPRVDRLVERMTAARDDRKAILKEEWDRAVASGETDHAIEILKDLDQYLSSNEARELENIARSIFKEKLLQLGVQFRFAVKEKRWGDALRIGLQVMQDFPNARMAQEVRDMQDVLRERARAAGLDVDRIEPAPQA